MKRREKERRKKKRKRRKKGKVEDDKESSDDDEDTIRVKAPSTDIRAQQNPPAKSETIQVEGGKEEKKIESVQQESLPATIIATE